jgi:hypothetical protein
MAAGLAPAAHATLYGNLAEWAGAVPGPITTIGFNEPYLAGMTVQEMAALDLSEYYARLGLHMRGGRVGYSFPVPVHLSLWQGVWSANVGWDGDQHFLDIRCDELITAIAVPSGSQVYVTGYLNGVLVETHSGVGGNFGLYQSYGVVFNQPVDRVQLLESGGDLRIDGLSWSTVPSPGALALLALAPTSWRRSRR